MMLEARPIAPEGSPLGGRLAESEGRAPKKSEAPRMGGLVLTRHVGQAIMIADEVEVQVVALKAGTVRLKIVAPLTIAVHRREVYDSIRSAPRPTAPVGPAPAESPASPGPRGGLVLTRHLGEKVMVGDEVEIEVVDVRSNAVRLRIAAPVQVPVHRLEVYRALRRDGTVRMAPATRVEPAGE